LKKTQAEEIVERYLIDCVVTDSSRGPYERIVSVGGPNMPDVSPPDASKLLAGLRRRGLAVAERPRWRLAVDDAIEGALAGRWSFYIESGAYDAVNVVVATAPSQRPYLKAESDLDTPDQLLFLARCR
jgi:hypothetical protein